MPKVTQTAHAMGITSPLTNSRPRCSAPSLRLAAGDGRRLRDDRRWRDPPSADRISQVVLPDGKSINLGSPPGNRIFSYAETYVATRC